MKIYIKNMVSVRCKMIVREEMEKLGFKVEDVQLGYAEIKGSLSKAQRIELDIALRKYKLELLDDKKNILIERIKNEIIEMIHFNEEIPKVNYSKYLSDKLALNYTYLSNTFSEVTGTTIEHYIIHHKIERVKELLMYNELNLTEISYRLHYSSVAHLSNQFKKVTGYTPTTYKRKNINNRVALETV